MKRELFVTMIALSLAGTMCRASGDTVPAKTDAAPGTPKIELDKMVYDFGRTSSVQQLAGSFVISNAGSALLELKKPTTSCGCTVAALKTDKLAPGETTTLGFTMNVGNVSHGRAEKRITVPSNDPAAPSLQLTVKADIVSIYDYSPQAIMFGDLHLNTSTNIVVQVKRTDGKPLGASKVETIGTGSQNVHAKLESADSSNSTATIDVEISAEGASRRLNNTIALYVGDGKPPILTIPVGGRFVGDVALDRDAIYWAIVDPANWPGPQGQNAATQRVHISSTVSDQKLELTNAVSSAPDVKVSVNPSEDGKTFEVAAVVDKAPKDLVRGTIKIETNLKSQPTIEIPFTINVLRHD